MTDQNPSVIDGAVLDQEFELDVMLAQDLMKQMKLAEDRRVCARYITQCHKMKSENIDIKINRNRFFRYLLKIMKKTITAQKDYFINMVRTENLKLEGLLNYRKFLKFSSFRKIQFFKFFTARRI